MEPPLEESRGAPGSLFATPATTGGSLAQGELKNYQILKLFFLMLRFALEQEIIYNYLYSTCYLDGLLAMNQTDRDTSSSSKYAFLIIRAPLLGAPAPAL